ncbi:CDP-glycerol glycerophosphotransferase [Methanobrevibacter gottschalkii]|uniref:CDP-glycerol glycerophosphotransferase n=1 Tax=Methanobrevibacter gottschalkii TaxID=190974 RepID=A0A1H7NG35_9EURY|nr:bifunctional glycosyltransferase family 2 protein/CDP-glycerol:glycerophosphate glycerophosphotransferase [Methanobrevibacter gottschalkii]SEL21965.1 CDP-glycerol glycerophosphotransferase [Methanobrevibacter gottschalkii]
MTFISIIIPFSTEKRYLRDCLNSIGEEKIDDAEIILILNGVDDSVYEFLENYNNLNINTIQFDEEIGVAKARNTGLDNASGEYVYFIDADDYLNKNSLNKLYNAAKKTNADLINGERINTSFIRNRFNEELEKPHNKPLKKGKLNNMNYSIKLLVGTKTDKQELMSCLHCLIKKDKISNIRFDENKRFFTDYEFMINVLENINEFYGVEDAFYAKRLRDDPINITSLNQEIEADDFSLHFKQYFKIKELLNNKSDSKFEILNSEVTNTIFNFYYHIFSHKFLKNKDERWRNIYFDEICEISNDFNEFINWKSKYEIKALQNRNIKSFEKFVKTRFCYVDLKRILKDHWLFNVLLYNEIYNKNEVKDNKIIFISFGGKYYSDSPKYLYEYLYENYRDKFEFIWVINDKSTKIPGNPKKVKRFSLEYYKEVAESKYWVTNGRHPARLTKKHNQVIVSTWHGTPLKRLGLDIGDVYTKNPNIKKSYIEHGEEWDYLISSNKYTSNILKSCFAYPRDVLETGYPRNDILYNAGENQINQIKESLNLPNDKKIILYAPTWRDDEFYDSGSIKFTLKLELDKLKEAIGDKYFILVRTHYFIADKLDLSEYEGFALDVSRYEDIAELYLISDLLITDYSSVFFDFANLKRPILYYTYDLEKYESMLRGFYINIHKEVPGPLLFTTEEVIDSIKNIEAVKKEYSERYDEFYERFCSIDDGNASKRIVNEVWKNKLYFDN